MTAACLLAGLVACTSASPGQPSPIESSTKGTATADARPRELSLDGIAPCALLPESAFASYDITGPGEPTETTNNAPSCLWHTATGYFGASLVVHEGIEAQETRDNKFELADPIEDFPTYTGQLPDDEKSCFTGVDVADGQYLLIQASLTTIPDDVPPVCDYSHQFAESLMESLVHL